MLRCPTCLNLLVEGGIKRCPACNARIKIRRADAPPDSTMAARPRALVERELQARIEAQTAKRFRQRRRAAKTARRIAALPPTLFEADVITRTNAGAWSPTSSPPPIVIDLPISAIHEVDRTPRVVKVPAEPEPFV